MVKAKNLLTLLFVGAIGSTFAQQDKLLTHWMYDKMSLNPGETGLDDGVCGTMIYRNQWDKVSGAPNSFVFNVEANLENLLPIPGGLGMSFYHDAIGFVRQNNVTLNYSYPVYTNYGVLGVGIGVGLINVGMQPDWVPPTNLFDDKLPIGFSKSGLDLNFGAYWRGNQGYYAGISSTHLSATKLSEKFNTGNGLNGVQSYNAARHYYIMGGYRHPQNIGPGKIEGNVLMRTDLVKFSSDWNARYVMSANSTMEYYGGITFRSSDALAFMLGGSMDNWTAGYSYDLTVNKLASFSNGTHELFVKYCYFIPPPPKTPSKHPRWL
jgi:type IX secretion system PorP/SprF family membrane protein